MAKYKIICGLALLLLAYAGIAEQNHVKPISPVMSQREKVVAVYTSQIGVREATGKNDGVQVETYLRYTKLGKGYAWCAAFTCWVYGQAGVMNPRSAWAPAMVPPGKMKRVAHVGFVDQWGPKEVVTVEGNTNGAGSREGDGVYKKKRLTRQIHSVASYMN